MVKTLRFRQCFFMALGILLLSQLIPVVFKKSVPPSLPSASTKCGGGSAKAFGFIPKACQISCNNVKELDALFCRRGFTLKKVKIEGRAPRLYLSKLPKDMRKKKRTANATFIQVLLPHILCVNEKILKDRHHLIALQKRQQGGENLPRSEKMWLSKLASDYRCKSTKIKALLVHVDIVPPSLALSQAMIETGGGRSQAALKKNSTFGHMQTKTKVAKFESLLANVHAYIHNLNRHAAYKEFRRLRENMRAKNAPLNSHKLAQGLMKYSVRQAAYVRDVQRMIHRHGLGKYDTVVLEGQQTPGT